MCYDNIIMKVLFAVTLVYQRYTGRSGDTDIVRLLLNPNSLYAHPYFHTVFNHLKHHKMKKLFLGIVAVSLLFATSCSKSSNTGAGGWSFKGISYGATTAVGTAASQTLSAVDASASNPSTLSFVFNTYPTASGTYHVVADAANSGAGNYLSLILTVGSAGYLSTGTDNVTAHVTVSGGKVSISSLSSVQLANQNVPSDISALTNISVSQQQ